MTPDYERHAMSRQTTQRFPSIDRTWTIDSYPPPWKVWAWVFATPVVVVGAVIWYFPMLWGLRVAAAAYRGWSLSHRPPPRAV